MNGFRVKGLVAATYTPFDKNGDVALRKIDEYCDHLHKTGVKHVFVNGSTGEGLSLTLEERKDVAHEWVKVNKRRLETIMVHVGCANLRDTQNLAKHAAEIGVHAIAAIPPLFFRPATVDHLVEYMRQVGDAAPSLPLYLYHIPFRTFVDFDMAEFLTKARGSVPSLRGIKFSCKDLPMLCDCGLTQDSRGDTYNMLFGVDQQLMSALVFGVDGAVGSTYNFMAALYQRMMVAMEKGDMETARQEQSRSRRVCKLIDKYSGKVGGSVPVLRMLMSLAGFDLGPPRCPLNSPSVEDTENLKQDLQDIGFFDWHKK